MMQQRFASNQSMGGILRVIVSAAGGFLLLLPLLFMLNIGASAADGKQAPAPSNRNPEAAAADCTTMSNVPVSECMSLVALYTQTNGAGWISNTQWLQFDGTAPCGWHGVVCNDGHVQQLLLAGNQLSGTLPLALGKLPELRRLRLENNVLQGRIPPTICSLSNLTDLSLAYNALHTQRRSVDTCLDAFESDWAASQTVGVRDLGIRDWLTATLHLSWTPIPYTEDGGYYEIGIANNLAGPYTQHGTTPDKTASSYSVTGLMPGETYYVRVRSFTPAHGDQPNDLRSSAPAIVGVTQATSGRVLVAAYFAADNDLATEVPYVLERIRRGTAINPNVQVVMLVDAREDGDTSLLEIAQGEVTYTDVVMQEWGVNELDTADPAVLAWFLNYARDTFPSERNVAAIIGHGIALAPEVDWPETTATLAAGADNNPTGKIPPLPKEHDYSPSDVTNRGYMSAVDVGQALMMATDNGANPFDVVFFDQCFQGSLDMLYEVRNSAHVYVASPNYAWLVAAYDRYMTRFTPTSTPAELAQSIINNYEDALNSHHPNAIFWISNSDLLAIATQVSKLADALMAAAQADEHAKIANAAQQSQYVDTTQCGNQNLQLGPPDELIGLESFGAALLSEFGMDDPYGVADVISELQPLMGNIARRSIAGRPYIAPTEHWNYANSLTILAPLPRNSPASVAWRASIYHWREPLTATWTVDALQPIVVTAGLAFALDGHWDEFLDAWYVGLKPTVGEWCQYIPPMQVVVSETEMLTLTANAITSDSLQLGWTPTDDTSATEYWLYARDPYAVSWQVDQVVPLSEAGRAFAGLGQGDYRYKIVARNNDLETIAQSNEVTVTITGGVSEGPLIPIHLPFVIRE